MSPGRISTVVGSGIFLAALSIGWIVTRIHTQEIGFAEISGIVHAAMGIGFSTGFLCFVVLRALKSKREG
ncbi:MAG TPA: hypothetical protein VLB09_05955 [Nitrospiria bacterium]|nr:hypothetical protein [Nitrospiria bacterium]